jgi:type I restriction enzyme, R subunit
VVSGNKVHRRPQKRADYLLRYTRDYPIAVIEAKAEYHSPGTGLQQAKDYAETLGLKFAYASNGHGIIEFDYLTGLEQEITRFSTPSELWERLATFQGLDEGEKSRLLTPLNHLSGKSPRYY